MNISIERACIDDALKLIEVQNKCFYDDYLLYGECPSYNESKEAIIRQIENRIVYKIIIDREIVGDIIVRKRENNNYYLRVISVIPKFQSLGIGSKAIEYIEKDNLDALEWELITPHKSYRNHHFYEKMGYIKIGEIVHSDVLTLWQYKKQMTKG
ncbi:MAG: GNAT family N-acetyltransferase [Maledivibacter sp.]|nr:GNAT family N-acetyltransferase [Maledivibacter sp.]